MRTLTLLLGLLAVGCEDHNSDGSGRATARLVPHGESMDGRVWLLAPGADAVVAVDPVARAAELVPVGNDPRVLVRSPNAERLYTLDSISRTISRVTPTAVESVDLPAPFNRLDWAPDGAHAIAWIDPSAALDVTVEGSVNLNAYAIIEDDGDGLQVQSGSFNFAPQEVRWEGTSRRALVRTDNRLVIFDVEMDPVGEWEVPFSPDDAVRRPPVLVETSPDGNRALVTVSGSTDLFVLRLDDVMIENVVGLARAAIGLAFSSDGSRAIVADGTSGLNFVDLETFENAVLTLPHPAYRLRPSQSSANPFAMAWDPRGPTRTWSRVPLDDPELAPDEAESFVMADIVDDIRLEPGETAAVVLHPSVWEGGAPASMSLFSFTERAPSRILLDAPVADLELLPAGAVAAGGAPRAVVVLRETARVVHYDLLTYQQVVLETYDAPVDVGWLPSTSSLFVVHDQSPALVSFIDPAATHEPPGGFPAVAGLGLDGILDRR